MNKMSTTGKIVSLAVIIVVVILLVMVYMGKPGGAAPSVVGSAATSTLPPGATPPIGVPSDVKPTTPAPSVAPTKTTNNVSHGTLPTKTVITFINPVANDTLTIGKQNPILWNKPGNFSGQLELLDAVTHKFVGEILPEVGPSQTLFTWNTRDLSVSRTNPAGFTVVPGTYVVELIYDGNNIAPAISPAFNISS